MLGSVSRSVLGGVKGLRTGERERDSSLSTALDPALRKKKRTSMQAAATTGAAPKAPGVEDPQRAEAICEEATSDLDLISLANERGLKLGPASIDQVCAAYGLGRRLSCRVRETFGAALELSLITERGDYELRALGRDVVGSLGLEVEAGLVAYLRQRRYPAPDLLTTVAGARYVRHEGVAYVVASAVAGELYDESDAQAISAGRSLGLYHVLVNDYPGPYRLAGSRYATDTIVEDLTWLRSMQRFVAHVRRRQLGALKPIFATTAERLKRLQPSIAALYTHEPRLITHGSFTRDEVLFQDDIVVNVKGFQSTSYDVRLVDVAHACISFCSTTDEPDLAPRLEREVYRQFLAGYAEVAALSEIESRSLPALIQAERVLDFVAQCRILLDAFSPDESCDLVSAIEQAAERLQAQVEGDANCVGDEQ